jgi:DNA-binding transcriptional ArsR family regulator
MAQRSSQIQINMTADDGTSITLDLKAPPDGMYKALSHERRRTVLHTLVDESGPIELRTLSKAVATREQTADTEPISAALIDQVHLSLYHTHLPRLAEHGLVTFDSESKTVDAIDDAIKGGEV